MAHVSPLALLRRAPAALDVLRGRRVAAPHPQADEDPAVSATELREMLDLAAVSHGLDPCWLREATSDGLERVANLTRFERHYRARRWATVEAGAWPEGEATWKP